MRKLINKTPFYLFNRLMIEHSNTAFRSVLKTPLIETDPASDVIFFSVLQEKDVRAYLLAAKSFLRFAPPLNVIIQSDGSLSDASCREIRAHLPHTTFLSRFGSEEYVRGRLGKPLLRLLGDTNWFVELKLLNPLLRFRGKYVILFDSDLLFMKRPNAALECIGSNPQRTFYSPGGNALAEPFHRIGFDFSKVDIRSFNTGFVGFLNDLRMESLERIASAIRDYDARLFKYYDVEQALWSVLLNETKSPLNLKSVDEHYVGSGWSSFHTLSQHCVMAHFVGATRFRNLMYNRLANRVIKELRSCTKTQ